MGRGCAAIFAALLFGIIANVALAQDVLLKSRDGAIELSGTLLGFDGEFYRLRTQYGELTVDGSGVICSGVGCPSLVDFVAEVDISGSATIGQVLMPALIESFARRNGLSTQREQEDPSHFTYVINDPRKDGKTVGRFHFRVTNTDEGFADLLADEADIVMALREIRAEERKLAKQAGLGDLHEANRSRVLALDATVPVVALGNPVDSLSLLDLSRVLSGEVNNWKELGGPNAPITLHMRDGGSGLAQGIEDRFPSGESASAGDLKRHDSNVALAAAVAEDPFGLGLASYSEVGDTKPLTLAGPCGFSLAAARRTIKTEDYPLTAPMFLYLPARRLPALARDFLSFTRSAPAQIVIRRAGFVDQAPEEVAIDLQGDRFANAILIAEEEDDGLDKLQRMTRVLSGMKRLTTSFRFEPGSARLDAQSRSNVQQLARSLEAGQYDARKLVFVGFSDGQGPSLANLAIAKKRSQTVMDAVVKAAETADLSRLEIGTEAFGEAMPMACDDTSWGRGVNRRVEVWLE